MKKPHYAGVDHVLPEPDSKGYQRVVMRGCGGYVTQTSDGDDYDCGHGYAWMCDHCPVVEERERLDAVPHNQQQGE